MSNATFEQFNRHGRAKLEHLDMPRLNEGFEGGEIHRASAGRTMITRWRMHVVNVKPREPFTLGVQELRVIDETKVLLDLRVTGIVPIGHART